MKRMYAEEEITPRLYEHKIELSKEIIWDDIKYRGDIGTFSGQTVPITVQLRFVTTSNAPITKFQNLYGVVLVEVLNAYFEDEEENTYPIYSPIWLNGTLDGLAYADDLQELASISVDLYDAQYTETTIKRI